jgi:hypothetical protein
MTFYNLELIQNFFPDHKVLIQSLIFFLVKSQSKKPIIKEDKFELLGSSHLTNIVVPF